MINAKSLAAVLIALMMVMTIFAAIVQSSSAEGDIEPVDFNPSPAEYPTEYTAKIGQPITLYFQSSSRVNAHIGGVNAFTFDDNALQMMTNPIYIDPGKVHSWMWTGTPTEVGVFKIEFSTSTGGISLWGWTIIAPVVTMITYYVTVEPANLIIIGAETTKLTVGTAWSYTIKSTPTVTWMIDESKSTGDYDKFEVDGNILRSKINLTDGINAVVALRPVDGIYGDTCLLLPLRTNAVKDVSWENKSVTVYVDEMWTYDLNTDTSGCLISLSLEIGDGNAEDVGWKTSGGGNCGQLYGTFTKAGTYRFNLIATPPAGSDLSPSKSYPLEVVVVDVPLEVTENPIIEGQVYFSKRATLNYVFDFFAVNYANYKSVVWDFGDGTTSHEACPSHDFGNSGSFTVTVTFMGKNTVTKTLSATIADLDFIKEAAYQSNYSCNVVLSGVTDPSKVVVTFSGAEDWLEYKLSENEGIYTLWVFSKYSPTMDMIDKTYIVNITGIQTPLSWTITVIGLQSSAAYPTSNFTILISGSNLTINSTGTNNATSVQYDIISRTTNEVVKTIDGDRNASIDTYSMSDLPNGAYWLKQTVTNQGVKNTQVYSQIPLVWSYTNESDGSNADDGGDSSTQYKKTSGGQINYTIPAVAIVIGVLMILMGLYIGDIRVTIIGVVTIASMVALTVLVLLGVIA